MDGIEPREFASLSAGLLARKGAARPAMRRQDTARMTGTTGLAPHHDDLGWNDWGDEAASASQRPVAEVRQAPVPHAAPQAVAPATPVTSVTSAKPVPEARREVPVEQPVRETVPEVLRQIERLASRMAPSGATRQMSHGEGRRAAFTLRLDADRHFRLRMAGALLNRSAQHIVTEALDKYLAEHEHIAGFCANLPRQR